MRVCACRVRAFAFARDSLSHVAVCLSATCLPSPPARPSSRSAGYVHDYPVEQLYRDNRLNMIHEGTAGIHALTLLGRKVQGGRAGPLFAAMRATAEEAAQLGVRLGVETKALDGDGATVAECLAECAASMSSAVRRAEETTAVLTGGDRASGEAPLDQRSALTNAHDYLTLMGHTTIAWMWLRSAIAASGGLSAHGGGAAGPDPDEAAFYRGKLHTCQFFFRHELPKTEQLARVLVSGDSTVSQMQASWF